jgi:hypothetical protein
MGDRNKINFRPQQNGRAEDTAPVFKVLDYVTAVHGRITCTPDISKIAFAKARKRRRKNDGN